jgi:serine phosphatase RsbU (regulator of sigma subunit)
MTEDVINSGAFQRAALKSESHRVIGLLLLLGGVMLFVIGRGLATGEFRLFVAQFLVLAAVIAHEAIMLRAVKAALLREQDLPPEKWVLNVLIESQIPTVGLLLLMTSKWLTPEQVLVAPVVLVYFLLIILSTLRLRPSITVLTGLLSALGYLFLTFYTQMTFQNSSARSAAFPLAVYFIYAGLILTGGIVAAVVASQIRRHVAAALREAELQKKLERINHDLDIARSIQQGLLPGKFPGLDEFDVAGWNQPADQTGGDYFDWQALPDGRYAISLADATGHGIGPALVSASCRAYARASFLANGKQDGLLDRLNRLLAEDLSANRFVTFAVALLNPLDSRVKVLSAGHGPILWCKYASDEIENLEAQGIPLGMISGVKYGRATDVCLGAGDMIVLVTDGFYEWANPEGEEFGLDRLQAVMHESRDCTPDEVISRLRSAVVTFCRGTKQQDDLTAVILKRKVRNGDFGVKGNSKDQKPAAEEPGLTMIS